MANVPELVQQGVVRAVGCWCSALLLLLAAGCRDPSAPNTGVPATGTLAVRVVTNVDFDPNGFSLSVDGAAPKFVPAVFPGYEHEVMVSGLTAGAHSLSVTGLAGHCATSPQGPIAFAVSAGTSTQVKVAVVCLTHG
jgi:hypothetical protein